MKKIVIIFFVFFTSCGVSSTFGTYCASCTEISSGFIADDYCGTSLSVDAYIIDLESYNPNYPDQVWVCDKWLD